jgi:hypothetical protein
VKPKIALLTAAALALIALSAPSCKLKGRAGADGGIEADGRQFKSKDGKFQLTAPRNWSTATSLNAEASIEAEGPEGYVILLTDTKEDLSDASIERYATSRAETIIKKLEGGNMGPAMEMTVNGRRAVQRELRGSTKNVNVMYLLTVIDTPQHLHQVLAWSTKSKFPTSRPVLASISSTFVEIAPAAK